MRLIRNLPMLMLLSALTVACGFAQGDLGKPPASPVPPASDTVKMAVTTEDGRPFTLDIEDPKLKVPLLARLVEWSKKNNQPKLAEYYRQLLEKAQKESSKQDFKGGHHAPIDPYSMSNCSKASGCACTDKKDSNCTGIPNGGGCSCH